MPPRIPDETRDAILADITSPENLSTRRIAARHGVSDRFVRIVARENGIEDAWSRERTESATRARLADLKERRSLLAVGLLDDAEALRERAWAEYEQVVSGPEGAEHVTSALPDLGAVRNAYAALGIAVDKHAQLLKIDGGAALDDAKSMLGAFVTGIDAAYAALKAEEAAEAEAAAADDGEAAAPGEAGD